MEITTGIVWQLASVNFIIHEIQYVNWTWSRSETWRTIYSYWSISLIKHGKKTKAQQSWTHAGETCHTWQRHVVRTHAHTHWQRHEKITTLSPGMWRLAISLLRESFTKNRLFDGLWKVTDSKTVVPLSATLHCSKLTGTDTLSSNCDSYDSRFPVLFFSSCKAVCFLSAEATPYDVFVVSLSRLTGSMI